jgi:hypothetical protein
MDARSSDAPAYWRVGGKDFVTYPDWEGVDSSSPRPALTVEPVEAFLQKYQAHGFGCGIGPPDVRSHIRQMGDALQSAYGAAPPPIMYIGCSADAEPIIWGDLQRPAGGSDSDTHVVFVRRGNALVIAS